MSFSSIWDSIKAVLLTLLGGIILGGLLVWRFFKKSPPSQASPDAKDEVDVEALNADIDQDLNKIEKETKESLHEKNISDLADMYNDMSDGPGISIRTGSNSSSKGNPFD